LQGRDALKPQFHHSDPQMTDSLPAALVVASIIPCEQYRYRVELPGSFDRKLRADIRRRAVRETNKIFLDCTRNYQAIGWLGAANPAFTDSQASPRDSTSKFLHLLICLKVIELSFLHHRDNQPAGEAVEFSMVVEVTLGTQVRIAFKKHCKRLGIQLLLPDDDNLHAMPPVGGGYRAPRHSGNTFLCQPIHLIEGWRRSAALSLMERPILKQRAKAIMDGLMNVCWPFLFIIRVVFSLYYRAVATRILKKMDGPRNAFLYVELFGGRNKDTAAYLRWKYGKELASGGAAGTSVIPFSHLFQYYHCYSFSAMRWASQALRRMKSQPCEGCIVVNFLIPPWLLVKLHYRRKHECQRKRKKLQKLYLASGDLIARLIYEDFITTLEETNVYAMEVSKCYQVFFDSVMPGVVVQADAVAKTARHFTACARRRGGRSIYIADRICTELRTSNKLIADEGDNPHFPDRCVIFDQVTQQEFLRQGFDAARIYSYHRNFSLGPEADSSGPSDGRRQVVIYLQDYKDNIGAMIHIGATIVGRFPMIEVLYQEHPNFPVCEREKTKLLKRNPERLRFLKPREPVDYGKTLALITGYSTAAVPGILQGVPLVWLRRQVDNSIYGEAYLDRIGIVADKTSEVLKILDRLVNMDARTLEACVAATAETKAIFSPTSAHASRDLEDALEHALADSFVEIEALSPAPAIAARLPLAARAV
jgi:hypothetical protein